MKFQFISKVLTLVVLLFCMSGQLMAQDSSVVKWTLLSTPVKNKANAYQIEIKGAIPEGWHLYEKNDKEGLEGLHFDYHDSSVSVGADSISGNKKMMSDQIFDGKSMRVYSDTVVVRQLLSSSNSLPVALNLTLNYELSKGNDFITEEQKLKVIFKTDGFTSVLPKILIPSIDITHPKKECGTAVMDNASKSLWSIFIIGFLGGLIALITPCVFPMIPLTVSFFTKRAQSRKKGITNAFLYGFFIFLIYILLSLPFHFLDSVNPEFLNNISTNEYVNIVLFVVIIAFALSFFGLYEITLPASFSTGADSKAGVGNVLGIFFMALTLAIVSFSCTGPILGSLLAGSLASNGGAMQLTAGMAGFGLALAMPFALLALFPNLMQSLPRSGGWLGTVKVTLGFLELALALKFLSQADLVKHWGILKRETFIGIWILIGIALTLFLFGKIKIGHDAPPDKLSTGRKIVASFFLLVTLYLIPGVTNTPYANLKLISGFPPPLNYSVYQKQSPGNEFEAGLIRARLEQKPILLDFTGYACVNCRRMEETVWIDPAIEKMMNEKFVVISLYVDDKKKLPAAQQFTYTTKNGVKKEIVTYGDLWSTLQTDNFANNSQPWYAIINTNEQLMNHPVGYTPDKKEYLQWLTCGWEASKTD